MHDKEVNENNNDNNDCKGCYFQNPCVHIKYSETCPCRTCIIKMICVKECEEYMIFRREDCDVRWYYERK